jgi:hypothetical protein
MLWDAGFVGQAVVVLLHEMLEETAPVQRRECVMRVRWLCVQRRRERGPGDD